MRGWAATIFRAFIVCLIVVAVLVIISEAFRRRVERDAATIGQATEEEAQRINAGTPQ